MKVAFTGTSSTGKTTTAVRLAKSGILSKLKLHHLEFPDTRKCLDKRVDKLSDVEKLAYQQQRFDDKLRCESVCDEYIVERSYVDLLAYRSLISPYPSIDEINMHIQQARKYSIHFFFPHGVIPYEGDGFRPSNEYSVDISNRIQEILNSHEINYVTLNDIKIELRCKIVENEIFKIKQALAEKRS